MLKQTSVSVCFITFTINDILNTLLADFSCFSSLFTATCAFSSLAGKFIFRNLR